jgi:hypothetical protein
MPLSISAPGNTFWEPTQYPERFTLINRSTKSMHQSMPRFQLFDEARNSEVDRNF